MAAKKRPGPNPENPGGQLGGSAGSYDDWTVKDLRKRAKELGLSGYSGKKKSALVQLLRSH